MKFPDIKFPVTAIIFLIGMFVGQIFQSYNSIPDSDELQKFEDTYAITKEYYKDSTNSNDLIEHAIKGMLDALDPHSVYIPPKDQESIEEEFDGKFQGIGVEFQVINDSITVVSPIVGGPSEKLGIISGDKIVKIEGNSCVGFENDEIIKDLRGEKGTVVNITIYRPSIHKEIEFSIERDDIPLYSVLGSFMLDENTGYINLSKFIETSTAEMFNALDSLKKHGMENIILDLRNNPGGLLSQATNIADIFLDQKKMIVFTKSRIDAFNEEFYTEVKSEYEDYPLIVLVNSGSASASEIVTGAIQDWDRGLVIGQKSFGKGLVQRPFILDDGSAVRLSISEYFTPSGRIIQRKYDESKADYYLEVYTRDDSSAINKDSLPTVVTKGGRTLIADGGITPDITVSSAKYSDVVYELTNSTVMYEFARKLIDSGTLNNYSSLKQFKSEYTVTNSDFNKFISFAKSKDVKFINKFTRSDKDYIKTRIKAYLARDKWNSDGWYSVLLEIDPIVKKALDSKLIIDDLLKKTENN